MLVCRINIVMVWNGYTFLPKNPNGKLRHSWLIILCMCPVLTSQRIIIAGIKWSRSGVRVYVIKGSSVSPHSYTIIYTVYIDDNAALHQTNIRTFICTVLTICCTSLACANGWRVRSSYFSYWFFTKNLFCIQWNSSVARWTHSLN